MTNHMAKLWSRSKYRYTTGAPKLVATQGGDNYISWRHVEPTEAREVLFTQWNERHWPKMNISLITATEGEVESL